MPSVYMAHSASTADLFTCLAMAKKFGNFNPHEPLSCILFPWAFHERGWTGFGIAFCELWWTRLEMTYVKCIHAIRSWDIHTSCVVNHEKKVCLAMCKLHQIARSVCLIFLFLLGEDQPKTILRDLQIGTRWERGKPSSGAMQTAWPVYPACWPWWDFSRFLIN